MASHYKARENPQKGGDLSDHAPDEASDQGYCQYCQENDIENIHFAKEVSDSVVVVKDK